MRAAKLARFLLLAGTLASGAALAAAGGGGPKVQYYQSSERNPGISVQLDKVLYMLSFANKGEYKVLPVVLDNPGDTPIILSRAEDTFTILAQGRRIPGVLDLAKANPEMWAALEPGLRQDLLYPSEVEARRIHVIYVLVPASEIQGLPQSFAFFIKSLGRTVEIKQPGARAD